MAKRFYWLKLKEDFFRDKAMKKLRKLAGGDTYTIIYLKMMLLSISAKGYLYYEGVEDDFCSELALDLDENTEDVKLAVAYLASKNKTNLSGSRLLVLVTYMGLFDDLYWSDRCAGMHRDREKTKEIPLPNLF